MHLEVPAVPYKEIANIKESESSIDVKRRVLNARLLQQNRFVKGKSIFCNSQMGSRDINTFCQLDNASQNLLKEAMHRLHLSARAYYRILKIARTIADLDKNDNIQSNHIAEAIQYRRMEKIN